MIIVIADDITGAAEIAGIALRHNLNVQFMTNTNLKLPESDVIVIATDTRSGNESEAINTIKSITNNIGGTDVTIFKKTDSVLRGFVAAEVNALMDEMKFISALIIPQNPSKGRIIKKGRYYIDNIPLDETSFCYDPEFPAKTSYVEEYLCGIKSLNINEPLKNSIYIADASTSQDIKCQLEKANDKTLIAGAADCFEQFLKQKINNCIQTKTYLIKKNLSSYKQDIHKAIIICGSTQSKSIANEPYIKLINAEEISMPYNVFHGAPADEWIAELNRIYNEKQSIIVTIGHTATGGKEYAIRLRNLMATVALQLTNPHNPDLLIIEGGATAFAVLNRLGWTSFKIEKEYTPGVVCMKYKNTHIILKPGSYPWGDLFKGNTI